MDDFIVSGPLDAPLLLLAHGAGADCRSAFLTNITELLGKRRIRTARFDFSYMAKRREDGKRRPPPKAEKLAPEMQTAIEHVAELANGRPLFIGGKSMGGRIATLVASEAYKADRITGCICLGYPFHPPGKPDRLRIAHLDEVVYPLLIAQGTRDPLGNKIEIADYPLSQNIEFEWLTDGDHDLKPRRASGVTHQQNLEAATQTIADFIHRHSPS